MHVVGRLLVHLLRLLRRWDIVYILVSYIYSSVVVHLLIPGRRLLVVMALIHTRLLWEQRLGVLLLGVANHVPRGREVLLAARFSFDV